ncbi:MAG: hypothetical protein N4A49_07165 [Marinifilaceae bacterium]|jgi:hypothetical protein|nr:hypothetical protein [Marinifilaceae bacterium]
MKNKIEMTDKEFKDWEMQVEKTKKHNEDLLLEFKKHLENKSLKPKTINGHIDNMRFFANYYLLRYDIIPIEKGSIEIGSYLGDFFIRKACWASKYTIQENIASFKKLYTFFCQKGYTSIVDLEEMKEIIKEEKSDWIYEVEEYYHDAEFIL